MVAVTGGTGMRDSTLGAVALSASLSRGQQDIRGVAALVNLVTTNARHVGVVCMVEAAADHPAIRDDGRRDAGDVIAIGNHFVTVSASGEQRTPRRFTATKPAGGTPALRVEENLLLEGLAGAVLF